MNVTEKKMDLIEHFWDDVSSRGNSTALIATNHFGEIVSVSWRELGRWVSTASAYLSNEMSVLGTPTDRIGYLSDNSLACVVTALSCMNLGVIEFPFDHRLPKHEIDRRWRSIQGLWIDLVEISSQLSSSSQGPEAISKRTKPTHKPESPALVLWTSGTTGDPKGVTLSRCNLVGNASAKLQAVPQDKDDRRLCVLPLCHGYARTCDMGTWLISGCTLAVSLGYEGIKQYAGLVKPTLMNLVPSLAKKLLDNKELKGLDQLRLIGCGGAGLSEEDYFKWTHERGVTVIQGYGLTETSPVICSATPECAGPGLVGDFVTGWDYRIENEQLFVRGPHVMLGYWNDRESTDLKIDSDGWLATGDQVEVDPETNQLKILGRIDDVIILDNANKIHPHWIEGEINTISGINHSMLIQRDSLELWIDVSEEIQPESERYQTLYQEAEQIIQGKTYGEPYSIRRFDTPLISTELTPKGTLRRGLIRKRRFSS